jgi:hypothetical protein
MNVDEQRQLQMWWDRLAPAATPQPADLAFFWMDDHGWQVMMVVEADPVRVIGACPIIGCVAERSLDEYLALGWQLKGYRLVPLKGLPEEGS